VAAVMVKTMTVAGHMKSTFYVDFLDVAA